MGFGMQACGGLREYLMLPSPERELTGALAQKAAAWRVEQLAKALGGTKGPG